MGEQICLHKHLVVLTFQHTYTSLMCVLILQCVPAILLDQLYFPSAQVPSVTRAMVIAPASLEWQVLSVTSVWWDTGALESMVAGHVTVLEAVTHLQVTASAGEWTYYCSRPVILDPSKSATTPRYRGRK